MLQSDSRSAGSPTQALREQFIGTWKLVSIESEESRLFGDRPVGILIYDADGNVAVQIMRNPRPSLAGGPAFPPAKEVQVYRQAPGTHARRRPGRQQFLPDLGTRQVNRQTPRIVTNSRTEAADLFNSACS